MPLCTSGARDKSVTSLKAIRVIRCLRLVKLARLLRASNVLRRWETRVTINHSMIRLGRTLVYQLLVLHWSTCALVLPTTMYENIQG